MKRILSIILVCLMMLCSFPLMASATEINTNEIETNEIAANATLIEGETMTGAINSQNDVDWYKFEATKDYFEVGFSINDAYLGTETTGGWDVEIFDSNSDNIISYSNIKKNTTYKFPFSGTIYIKVTSHYVNVKDLIDVKYDITVNQGVDANREDEYNNIQSNANTINIGESYTASLYKKEDVDWYKFNALDYFTLDFGFDKNAAQDRPEYGWDVTIFDESLNEICAFNNYREFTSVPFPFTGTIYVKVAVHFVNSNDLDNIYYNIKASSFTNDKWESEYNNTSNTANEITVEEIYTGTLFKKEDVDWYKFNALDYFTLDFGFDKNAAQDRPEYGWDVTVYDETLNEIHTFSNYHEFTSVPFPFTGAIYVKVAPHFTNSNVLNNILYNLKANTYTDDKWESEHNNSSTTANKISQSKIYNGTLYNKNDVDFFKFKSTTNAFKVQFSINLNEISVDAIGYGWKVTVYPVDSAASIIGDFVVSEVGSFETPTLPYEKGKEYFIKVEADYTGSAPVNLTYHIAVVDATDSKKWEVEKGGNAVKYATTISDSYTYYGNLINKNDTDYYKYSVTAAGKLKVTFARPDSDADGYGYKIKVINSAGKEIAAKTVNDLKSSSFTATVSKGTYYVIVSAENTYNAPSNTINYNIKVALTLKTPTLSKVAASGTKALKVTWKKMSDITGYEIQYSTSKSFSSAKTTKATSYKTTYKTIKSLRAKKTYYVRIRTYKIVGSKKYYSAWTSYKYAKTK